MRWILAFLCITLTRASRIHFTPSSLAPATTQYHKQDSKGFYSYGYSGDTSAKAEYKRLDGSSQGFYSYIDSDGKLQTVRYEAGRRQGFRAAATNLPKAPVDNRVQPAPVTDTPEVQMAKLSHFEAYREAELRAALTPEDTGESDNDADFNAVEEDNANSSFGDDNAREHALALSMQHRANIAGDEDSDSDSDNDSDSDVNDNTQDDYDDNYLSAEQHMNSYGLSNIRYGTPLISLQNPMNFRRKSADAWKWEPNASMGSTTYETVRVPVHAYYTVSAPPATKYTVRTPTSFRSVPRAESLKLGHNLPTSLSTIFSSLRVNSNA